MALGEKLNKISAMLPPSGRISLQPGLPFLFSLKPILKGNSSKTGYINLSSDVTNENNFTNTFLDCKLLCFSVVELRVAEGHVYYVY